MAYKVMLDHKTTEFRLFEHLDEARKFLMDMFDEPGHGVWEKETELRDLRAGKTPYDYLTAVFLEDADVLDLNRYKTAGLIGHVYPKNKKRLNMLSDYYWIPIDLSESKEEILAKAKNIPLKDDGSLFDCGPKAGRHAATRPDLAECFLMDTMEAPDGVPFKDIEAARAYTYWAMKPRDCPVKMYARIKLKDGTTVGAVLKLNKHDIVYGHGDDWRKVLENGRLGARVRYKGPDIEWMDKDCEENKKEIFRK